MIKALTIFVVDEYDKAEIFTNEKERSYNREDFEIDLETIDEAILDLQNYKNNMIEEMYRELKEEVSDLETQVDDLESEVRQADDRVEDLYSDISSLEQEVDECREEIEELQAGPDL